MIVPLDEAVGKLNAERVEAFFANMRTEPRPEAFRAARMNPAQTIRYE